MQGSCSSNKLQALSLQNPAVVYTKFCTVCTQQISHSAVNCAKLCIVCKYKIHAEESCSVGARIMQEYCARNLQDVQESGQIHQDL